MKRLALSAAVLTVFLGACTSKPSNELHIYTSLDTVETPVYIEAFEKASGIKVKWVRLSAGEAVARLDAEKNNPQVSVWFAGPSPEFIVGKAKGLFENFQPQLDYTLAPPHRDADWAWTGIYFGAIGFACNEKYLADKKLKCPDSWAGLLNPAFKGQVAMAFPYTSGTAYTVVAALLELYGEEKGWDYLKKLDGQVHHYNKSGAAAVTQVGLGEVAVGISFSHDVLQKGRASGYPVELSIPKDGTPTEIGCMALIKGAKEPELAKKFITYMLSVEAQSELQKFQRVPLHPKAPVAPGAVTAAQIKIIPYDTQKAADNQKAILEKWRKATAR